MPVLPSNQSFTIAIEDFEDFFRDSLPDEPATSKKKPHYSILHNLTPNRRAVINLCKEALVREFGTAEASRYITHREGTDERSVQYWLRYQIEKTPYPDTYCLVVDAQKWFDGAEVK